MSKTAKTGGAKGLVPRLRFAEFRGAPSWSVRALNKTCTVNPPSGKLPDSFVYVDLESVEKGRLIRKTLVTRESAPSRAQRVLQDQDVLFQVVRPYQRNNLLFRIDGANDYVASTGYAQLRAHASASFLYQTAQTDTFVAKVVAKCTGSSYPAINPSDLAEISVTIPGKDEQQKIADCLSSLDDLIAAHADKLAALKQHKQGLLEHLFPREGETVPRLRFPEFREAPEWSTRPFDDFVTTSFYGTSSSTSEAGRYPVLRMGNMVDGGLSFSNLVYLDLDPHEFEKIRLCPGDILLNRTNSLALVGKVSLFEQSVECVAASYIVTYRVDMGRLDPVFCNLMLNTPRYRKNISAMARPSVSQANINPTTFRKELLVSVPLLAEQQRIAACLTTLDTLITAQSEKLAALKQHKQGLLQQLFPAMDEATA